jgi:hypothetical protein
MHPVKKTGISAPSLTPVRTLARAVPEAHGAKKALYISWSGIPAAFLPFDFQGIDNFAARPHRFQVDVEAP